MAKIYLRLVPAVAAILLISGCSQASTPRVIPSSTPTKNLSGSPDHSIVYTQAFAYLQAYLDSWRKNGAYLANQKYLGPSMGSTPKKGNPVLISGTVTNMQQYSWAPADHFTVMVSLDLRFSGDSGAWGSGTIDRFVTFVRSSASVPYRLTLNTGPAGPLDHSADYGKAIAYLQSFLDSWKEIGFYAAGQKYFDAVSKTRIQSQGNPVLVAGTVKSLQPYSWVSANDFMVQVDFDLRFSKEFSLGDGGWRSGAGNTQFITFTRTSASAPYQITLGTGP